MTKILPFTRLDDRDIEITNLCMEFGCDKCPGYDDSVSDVLVFCIHGCHAIDKILEQAYGRNRDDCSPKATVIELPAWMHRK